MSSWNARFLARVFLSSTLTWILSIVFAIFGYQPRDAEFNWVGLRTAVETAMTFNPAFVTVGAAVSLRVMSEWLRHNKLNRWAFGGWIVVVTCATSVVASLLLSAMQGIDEVLGGLLVPYLWFFIGLLPIWSLLSGILVGPPANRS